MDKGVIFHRDARLIVKAPYNESFIKKAKALGGFWNEVEQEWEFPMDKEKEVKELVLEIYGDFETED